MNAITKLERPTAIGRSAEVAVTRAEANLGALVTGFDFSRPIDKNDADLLRSLLWEHQVLFFHDTGLDDARQAAIGRIFGEPDVDSIAKRRGQTADEIHPFNTGPYANGYYGTRWHADATYLEHPYQVSVLRSVIAPELGGDTAFSSGISAYESLPQAVKDKIDGLTAIHRPNGKASYLIADKAELADYLADFPGVEHPVVIRHPFTGKRILYVNETFTHEIVGLEKTESDELLAYLTQQFYRPENIARMKWRPGSLAIWDNRSVQHYGVADYGQQQRQLVRIVARGDRPER